MKAAPSLASLSLLLAAGSAWAQPVNNGGASPTPAASTEASPESPATAPSPATAESPASSEAESSDSPVTEGAPSAPQPAPAQEPQPAPQPATTPPAPDETEAEEPDETSEGVRPTDTLGGHFLLAARGALAVPFGEVSSGVDQSAIAGVGFGAGLELGLGVSRSLVVGAYGDFITLSEPETCPNCSPASFGAGAFVQYHLVQGLRFDPWISYGMGFRSLTLDNAGQSESYQGLEWMRLGFGGDWYLMPNVGFGPFLEFGAASFLKRPAGETDGGVNWRFQTGLRIIVDLPGH